jgi:hypothetical protein
VVGVFDDLDIRFEYPADWELDVDDDGARTTITVQSPGGLAFAMVTLDETRPAPDDLADEALEAMREEYPGLDARPGAETIDAHRASGHDIEFISLDMLNSCAIRSYRTPRRTVLVFSQWSDLDDNNPEAQLRALRRSIAETSEE